MTCVYKAATFREVTCVEEAAAYFPDFVRSIGNRINPVEKRLEAAASSCPLVSSLRSVRLFSSNLLTQKDRGRPVEK